MTTIQIRKGVFAAYYKNLSALGVTRGQAIMTIIIMLGGENVVGNRLYTGVGGSRAAVSVLGAL